MQNTRQTAGKTATTEGAYPKRARLFSPDGHARKDIIATVSDIYVERFLRNHARRIGWPCTIRKVEKGGAQ